MSFTKITSKLLTGIFISLALLVVDNLTGLGGLRNLIEIVVGPQRTVARFLVGKGNFIYQEIRFIHSGPARIADLERRLSLAQQQARSFKSEVVEGENLKKILGVKKFSQFNLTTSSILSYGADLVIVNYGFEPGQTVVSPEGVIIGFINKVDRWTASVTTIAKAGGELKVKVISEDGQFLTEGVLTGGIEGLAVSKIPTAVDLKPGAIVFTSGADNRTPPALLVGSLAGEIKKEEASVYQKVKVDMAAKINDLKTVIVIGE